MIEPLDIPPQVLEAARTVSLYFKTMGVDDWVLMALQSRSSSSALEHWRDRAAQAEKERDALQYKLDRLRCLIGGL